MEFFAQIKKKSSTSCTKLLSHYQTRYEGSKTKFYRRQPCSDIRFRGEKSADRVSSSIDEQSPAKQKIPSFRVLRFSVIRSARSSFLAAISLSGWVFKVTIALSTRLSETNDIIKRACGCVQMQKQVHRSDRILSGCKTDGQIDGPRETSG